MEFLFPLYLKNFLFEVSHKIKMKLGKSNIKIHTHISIFDLFKMYIAGAVNKLITNKFNEYVPIKDKTLIKFKFSEKL